MRRMWLLVHSTYSVHTPNPCLLAIAEGNECVRVIRNRLVAKSSVRPGCLKVGLEVQMTAGSIACIIYRRASLHTLSYVRQSKFASFINSIAAK